MILYKYIFNVLLFFFSVPSHFRDQAGIGIFLNLVQNNAQATQYLQFRQNWENNNNCCAIT